MTKIPGLPEDYQIVAIRCVQPSELYMDLDSKKVVSWSAATKSHFAKLIVRRLKTWRSATPADISKRCRFRYRNTWIYGVLKGYVMDNTDPWCCEGDGCGCGPGWFGFCEVEE